MARTIQTTSGTAESIGERLARLRRERGILRLNAELILRMTGFLKVSSDKLLGIQEPKARVGVGNRRIARRLKEIERLPRRDQEALLRTIDAFFSKAG